MEKKILGISLLSLPSLSSLSSLLGIISVIGLISCQSFKHHEVIPNVKGDHIETISTVKEIDKINGINEAKYKELTNPINSINSVSAVNRNEHWHHYGNKRLNINRLKYEIYQISKTLPNIRYTKNLSNLIIETLMVETNLGRSNYLKNDHKTRNYGLGQFVLSTVKHILDLYKKNDPKVYAGIMKYYDNKLSLKDNIRKNVRFTIALQLEYYTLRDKNLLSKISTQKGRAKIWKEHYNTYLGSGTINAYLTKANSLKDIL